MRAAWSAARGTTHGDTDVAKDLPRNGPKRDVLPGLDVAHRPVVDQADTEHVLGDVALIHRDTELRRSADDEPDLGLDVEPSGRAEYDLAGGVAALT